MNYDFMLLVTKKYLLFLYHSYDTSEHEWEKHSCCIIKTDILLFHVTKHLHTHAQKYKKISKFMISKQYEKLDNLWKKILKCFFRIEKQKKN